MQGQVTSESLSELSLIFINAKDYAPGVYFITLHKEAKVYRKKIVIN